MRSYRSADFYANHPSFPLLTLYRMSHESSSLTLAALPLVLAVSALTLAALPLVLAVFALMLAALPLLSIDCRTGMCRFSGGGAFASWIFIVGAQRPIPVQGLFWIVCSHHLLSLLGGGSLVAPAAMPRHAGGQIDKVRMMASGAPVMRCYE